jgi:hypothetical protein
MGPVAVAVKEVPLAEAKGVVKTNGALPVGLLETIREPRNS